MEWPKEDKKTGEKTGAVRLGYIRQGQKVPVIAEPHPKANCKEGWYELVAGRLRLREVRVARHESSAHQARAASAGHGRRRCRTSTATTSRTARRSTAPIPSREERLAIEPWLSPKKAKSRRAKDDDSAQNDDSRQRRRHAALTLASDAPPPTRRDPLGVDPRLDAGVPWYLRDYDGGKPQVTLDDLKRRRPRVASHGEGLLPRARQGLPAGGGHWWKTTGGLFAPFERVFVYKQASDFHGVWLDENALPAAGITGDAGAPRRRHRRRRTRRRSPTSPSPAARRRSGSSRCTSRRSTSCRRAARPSPRATRSRAHSVLQLTGESVTINGATYDETDDGWWMKAAEGTKTQARRPAEGPEARREVDRRQHRRRRRSSPTRATSPSSRRAVSTGLVDKDDKEKDHHTPPGTFRIREKHIAATMDGDVASDGPYSIEDVPWIMYFNGSYALHGAFWHNNFGTTKSHGCVNLSPQDAKALFALDRAAPPRRLARRDGRRPRSRARASSSTSRRRRSRSQS